MSPSGYDSVTYFPQSSLDETAKSLISEPVEIKKQDLTILHLSDLHFGDSFRFKPRSGASLAERIKKALEKKNLIADAVVLSGDFGDKQPGEELDDAKKQLDQLRKSLDILPDRWIVIPGNHDINWVKEKFALNKGANPVEAHLSGTTDYFEYIYRPIQLGRKCSLTSKLKSKWSRPDDEKWKNDPIRHFMPSCATFRLDSGGLIEIHGFNSCLVEGSKWPGMGYVGKDQLDLFDKISQLQLQPKHLKIAVLHHHVKEVSKVFQLPGEDISKEMRFSLIADARWFLDELIAKQYGMLLHGHQHEPFISHEVRSCFGSDDQTWNRDFIDERLVVFGAGSVSREDPGLTNSFFVYRIENDGIVEAWNFSLGPGLHDDFAVKSTQSCRQALRNCLIPEAIRKRVGGRLAYVESIKPDDKIGIPKDCDPVEGVIGRSLHEILAATGALKREGEDYRLNMPPKEETDENNRGRSNKLPVRFASLLRLALEYHSPLFGNADDWLLPQNREAQPHIFNLIRWASLNLAKGILGSEFYGYFKGSFEKKVLSEYPAEMRLPPDICLPRYFVGCVVVRRAKNDSIELLLRHNDEWDAWLLPVIELKDYKYKQEWKEGTSASRLALARSVFTEIISTTDRCNIVEFPSKSATIDKKQISPSKGVWNHYSFALCFMKCDAPAQAALDRCKYLSFKQINEIKKTWDAAAKEAEQGGGDWLKDPEKRAAVANRILIQTVLDVLDKPDEKWFYKLD
jgi:3',5'-cyclic AMP phosphodiesterase CpdA